MPVDLQFNLAPELLDEGSGEERATFGIFTVKTATQSLTEGFDFFLNGYREGPLVSVYYVAQWMAWNWWRLRWEPRSTAQDWALAHRMTAIGEGYMWPKLDICSDGILTMLVSHASQPGAKPFRYIGAFPAVVPSTLFEAALDAFMPRVIGRLRSEGFADSNLERIWSDVLTERGDHDVARRRRLEALLGRDPDEVGDDTVEALIRDENLIGKAAVDEVAAEHACAESDERGLLTADALERVAREVGHPASVRDSVALSAHYRRPEASEIPAWKLGATAAIALRAQERLGSAVITDRRLAQMAGSRAAIVTSPSSRDSRLSFALDDEQCASTRIVLAARHKTGRRFSLARIIGDRLMNDAGALYPATHAYTYRQKAQRSFAAELLSPFDVIEEMSRGDYSMEKQQDIADYFSVSPMLINASLKNNGRLERDAVDEGR